MPKVTTQSLTDPETGLERTEKTYILDEHVLYGSDRLGTMQREVEIRPTLGRYAETDGQNTAVKFRTLNQQTPAIRQADEDVPFITFSRMGLVNTGTGFELMAGEPTLLRAYTAQAVCEEVDGEVQFRALAVEDPTNGRYYLHVHDAQDRPMKGLATHMMEVDPLVDIAILRAPVEGQKYYVFVRGADRKLHYLTVDMAQPGYSTTTKGQVTDAKVFGGLVGVGRNMLARENRTMFGSRVLYVSTFEDTDSDGLGIMQMHTLQLEGADVNLKTSHWYEVDGITPMVHQKSSSGQTKICEFQLD